MNDLFQVNSSVFFWTAEGQTVYGTVQSTADRSGVPMLLIKTNDGREVTLPAGGVSYVGEEDQETRPQHELMSRL